MKLNRLAWAAWALVPVGVVAYHFGPGQQAFQQDRAFELQKAALRLEASAEKSQEKAYAAHLAALDARRKAFLSQSADDATASQKATECETQAYQIAGSAWKEAADAYGRTQEVAKSAVPETVEKLRWSQGRALVRAGDVWNGIEQLETILDEIDQSGRGDTALALATREEIGTAYYYGARLRRMAGDSKEEWMVPSGKARQQFRYLAEQARAKGLDTSTVANNEKNVEIVLDLEQSTQMDLEGKPLPKNCNCNCNGKCPKAGKKKQPPRNKDARGAGGSEDVRSGW